MIASLSGLVETKSLDEAVIDVRGVGYRVYLSLRSMARLPSPGEQIRLRIRTVVREDVLDLYGFISAEEEELFLLLTSVSHVGPKSAMTVLSGLEPTELAQAIANGDIARLTKLHGVGKKTAERLVVELREKVRTLAQNNASPANSHGLPRRNDLVNALVNLGYRPAQAQKAAEIAEEKAGANASLDLLIPEALRAARG